MTEHYCSIHKCKFYRNEKNGKVWYSHKIKGDGYCNESKEEIPPEQEEGNLVKAAKAMGAVEAPDKMTPELWDAKEARTRKSIERQKALELIVNLVIADKIPLQEASAWVVKFEKYLESGK